MLGAALSTQRLQLVYWFEQYRTLPAALVILLLAGGVIFLLYGRTVFRFALAINAGLIAAYLGWHLGGELGYPRAMALGFAAVFALLAWPLFQFAIAGVAGTIGAGLATAIAASFAVGPHYQLAAATLGFVVLAILGWYVVNPVIVGVTAVQGATIVVLSLLALVDKFGGLIRNVPQLVAEKPAWTWAFILAMAVIGVAYQSGLAKGPAGEKPSPAQPNGGGK